MINTKARTSEGRSSRLDSITNFDGNLGELVQSEYHEQGKCGSLCSRGLNQCNVCPYGVAFKTLANIDDTVIIDHAPIGCAAIAIAMNSSRTSKAKKSRELLVENLKVFSTNMKESDCVFGASEKLRETIIAAYERHHPSAIIVTASCVSGIIGEDIAGVTDELTEELNVPIIPVFCEGIKSKIWADGFDVTYHALLKYIVKEPQKKTNKVNFINFSNGMKKKIKEMLEVLGVEPLFVASFESIENLSKMSESIATVTICGTWGTYMGTALEEKYGVPYIGEIFPHGIRNYEKWYKKLAELVGKEEEAEEYLRKEREYYMPQIEELREKLKGTRAVLGMGAGFAFEYISVMAELNVTVEHIISFHHDRKHDGNRKTPAKRVQGEGNSEMKVSVCDMQNFEILKILKKVNPDIFVNRHSVGDGCVKLGIPLIFVGDEFTAFGYGQMVAFGNYIFDSITNRNLIKNIQKHAKLPYKKLEHEELNDKE